MASGAIQKIIIASSSGFVRKLFVGGYRPVNPGMTSSVTSNNLLKCIAMNYCFCQRKQECRDKERQSTETLILGELGG
jgi:hypothetical protein